MGDHILDKNGEPGLCRREVVELLFQAGIIPAEVIQVHRLLFHPALRLAEGRRVRRDGQVLFALEIDISEDFFGLPPLLVPVSVGVPHEKLGKSGVDL